MLAGSSLEVAGESGFFSEEAARDSEVRDSEVVLVAGEENLGASPPDGYPAVSFVILAEDEERALAWLRDSSAFGWGVLPPDAAPEEVVAAAVAAASGLAVLSRELAEEVVEAAEVGEGGPEAPPETLTAREREVLELLAGGLPNKTIARELYISEHTVKFHLSSIFAKLGVSSRAGAVSRGAHFGLVSL